ncbi:DNA-binding protein [Actinoplanes sp. SE50]|uniref:helix-turn-helix domain-containing protein n=1 Tax=unclassified Actinoplanes TaxID=2626549 RepID=UPI00023EC118|nr:MULTISPECIES: helix-turn-helix transcriptional regulator [unclassified Actinoplanes]AEV85772.1 DNA-binding protein [Actinoplanes sp. SE50/110]ATO84165.1 DNA-binding protein [Actinoplanes sp. SE50]SLM01575.1 helix-turn-helix domain-containing protein [Actinoplanes sp. SE50/110]
MARPIGPTIPRWQLGEQLSQLRTSAGKSQQDAANRLGCSISKIQKIEGGEVGMKPVELEALLVLYGAPDALSGQLQELRTLGAQRGWWSKYGAVSAPFSTFLGLESAATKIRIFEPLMVHGLLQTEAYAHALTEASNPSMPDTEVDRQVRIRLERQDRVFLEEPPEIWVVLDEAVLRRQIGSPQVMAEQLNHLLRLPKRVTVQVVPFANGSYPGTLGALTLFEFAEELHSPVAYVESQAGNLYLEREDDLARSNVSLNHITAAALSKQESRELIAAVARQLVPQ